jgi:hypothetical protein
MAPATASPSAAPAAVADSDLKLKWDGYITEVARNRPDWGAEAMDAERDRWHERNGLKAKFPYPWGEDGQPPRAEDEHPDSDGVGREASSVVEESAAGAE